jgi:type II secretory pathway pseudopilin PulG
MNFRPTQFRAAASSAFTLIEIAISLAVIGFALVAIIGVLPLGMNVQRENREGTIINQDASVFMTAISKGAQGMNDLTNYVYAITNNWMRFNVGGVPGPSGSDGYTVQNSNVTKPGGAPLLLINGFRIIGLLSTPQITDLNGNPTTNLYNGGYSNHIVAYVRSLSGSASEKPPQDNQIIQQDAFGYHLYCVNAAVAMDTNSLSKPYNLQLAANLHELRLTFFWPVQPNGSVGNGRQSYRTLIAGQVITNIVAGNYLYFYQSQSFTNAL